MKIALAQLNYMIGAFEENSKAIINAIEEARENFADIVIFSELSVCGYPPLDLLEHKSFVDTCQLYVEKIALKTRDIAAIIGHLLLTKDPKAKNFSTRRISFPMGKL